jgi:hypothetical protein
VNVTDTMMRDDRSPPAPLPLLPKRLLVVRNERRGATGVVSEATVVTAVTVATEAGEHSLSSYETLVKLSSSFCLLLDHVGTTGEVARLRTLE